MSLSLLPSLAACLGVLSGRINEELPERGAQPRTRSRSSVFALFRTNSLPSFPDFANITSYKYGGAKRRFLVLSAAVSTACPTERRAFGKAVSGGGFVGKTSWLDVL